MKKLLIVIVTLLLLSACGEGELNSSTPPSSGAGGKNSVDQAGQGQVTPSPSPAFNEDDLELSTEATEGEFELILYTSKTHYEVDEPIEVYAELVYVGEQDEIEIGHAMYPVGFGIREHTRDIHIEGVMAEPYVVTQLKRNEPVRYDYTFTGGYSEEDGEDYLAFIEEIKDNALPEGQYTITAYASFGEHLPNETEKEPEQFQFSTAISFVVGSK